MTAAGASHAAIVNGGFESGGLNGWVATGVATTIGAGGGGAIDGTRQAYLDTSPSDDAQGPHLSSLSQTFDGAGSITFWWNFLTNEPQGSSYNDLAYVVLDGVTHQLADTFSAFSPSTLGGYADMTGYRSMSLGLSYHGTHRITFYVADAIDGAVDSALLIDRVQQIPEPGALSLAGLALVAAALTSHRARRQQAR